MHRVQISGTGLYTPSESISNSELVDSYNKYVDEHNAKHKKEIENGSIQPLEKSSVEFIEKASGVKSRFVQNKSGILDTSFMRPKLRERGEEELSNLAEMGVAAAKEAIENSGINVAAIYRPLNNNFLKLIVTRDVIMLSIIKPLYTFSLVSVKSDL